MGKTYNRYKPEYAERLAELFAEGQDVLEVCQVLGIGRSTFYHYVDTYPEFAAAYERARDISHAWWERKVRTSITEGLPNGVGSLFIFALKNKLGWKDKQEFEHTGANGGPIENAWVVQPVKAKDADPSDS